MSAKKTPLTKEQKKIRQLEQRVTTLERTEGEWHAEMERIVDRLHKRIDNIMANR